MNYRHAFHAGNFADVFKHVLLTRILLYLTRKPTPIAVLDTHAGCGRYDLAGSEAGRTGEWRGGIGRLDPAAMPSDAQALLEPYFEMIGGPSATPARHHYPGSPMIAQWLLRPQDRLVANELHPQDHEALAAALAGDRRVRVTKVDGYAALAAFAPPRERRGIVLVDPPFETADDWDRMEAAIRKAYRRWATGVFALWYPIKEPASATAFAARFRDGTFANALRLELLINAVPRRGAHDALELIGCGMIVVNPPFALRTEASVLLPFLARRLGSGREGSWRCERLGNEAED